MGTNCPSNCTSDETKEVIKYKHTNRPDNTYQPSTPFKKEDTKDPEEGIAASF